MSWIDADHWREIWGALRGNTVRTILTAFGVFWGIYLLMVMLGSGNGLRNGSMQEFEGSATNSVFIWAERTAKPYHGMPVGRSLDLTTEDVDAIRAKIPEAEIVCPHNQLGGFRGGNNVTRGTKAGGFSVMGEIPEITGLQPVPLLSGRFLDPMDLDERRKVAVIGTRVQEVLFSLGENPIGGDIQIDGVYFTVIGTFTSIQTGNQADRELQTIYVPFTTFEQAFHSGNRVGWLGIKSRDGVPVSVTESRVKALLRQRHVVAPDDDRAFGSWNMEKEYQKVAGVFTGIRLLVWIVGIGTLAAGVIGVSNIMLVIVRERTHEIGIRRSVGATPFAITSQILLEAFLLTASAGYLGLIGGMLTIDGVAALVTGSGARFFRNPGVDLHGALAALAILVISGIAAGLLPAWRAIRISTVEALRSL